MVREPTDGRRAWDSPFVTLEVDDAEINDLEQDMEAQP
jgi:hypothetical protein